MLTYLGRNDEAYGTISPYLESAEEAPSDYAFVLHHYAWQSLEMEAARRALALYKQADDPAGTAAVLYLMGRISLVNGQTGLARGYLERALAVSRALEDEDSMRRITSTLEDI